MATEHPQLTAYRRIGIGQGDVGMGERPAVLVVDLQRHFTEGVLASPRTAEVLKAVARLLTAARRAQLPVFFVRVAYDDPDEAGPVWSVKSPAMRSCLRGTPATEVHPTVAPQQGDEVLDKPRASGFFGTSLDDVLLARAIDTVILTGTSTSGCVRATAVDAMSLDYRVIVVADCCDDRAPASHEATLVDLEAKYADVLTVDEVLDRMRMLTATG